MIIIRLFLFIFSSRRLNTFFIFTLLIFIIFAFRTVFVLILLFNDSFFGGRLFLLLLGRIGLFGSGWGYSFTEYDSILSLLLLFFLSFEFRFPLSLLLDACVDLLPPLIGHPVVLG